VDRAAVLRRLVPLLRPQRWRLLGGVAALVLSTALQLAVAPQAQALINQIQRYAGRGQPRAVLAGAALIFVTILARSLFVFLQSYLLTGAIQRLGHRLRERVFEHTLTMPHAFFDDGQTGALVARMTGDVPILQLRLLLLLSEGIGAPFMLAGGVACLFWLNWQLALVSILSLPAIGWIVVAAGRRQRAFQARVQALQAEITAVAAERFAGARTVKAFGTERLELDRFAARSEATYRQIVRSERARAATAPLIEIIASGALVAVLGYGSYQIISGAARFDLGGLAALILVLERISNAARQAGNISMNLGQAAAAAERIFRFLDLVPAVQDRPGARPLGRIQGRVEFDRVSFGYSPSRPVLRDLSFRIEPGQVVALVGRSGMGKSTIAALIPRFYDVTSGRVLVDGRDVREATLASLRTQVAVVPQEVHLFSGSIRENIEYGRCGAAFAEVESAARAANAHEFISRLPQGYETQVGERGARLSGGQRQRLAIARALLRDPRILLLDEATASLDSESEALVQEALERLMVGRTTLVIAHRLSTVRSADVILVIEDGQIAERGAHPELLSRGGLYAEMHGRQFADNAPPCVGFRGDGAVAGGLTARSPG
jgi:subfamily B ATP-binding cassette protein MsbA